MRFNVTARNDQGLSLTLTREAESRAALIDALRAERLLVLSIEEVRETRALPPFWHPSWLKPMTGFEVELGLRQIASMLKSGITLLQALKTTEEQAASPRVRRVWAGVGDCVLRGGTFADALRGAGGHFNEIVICLSEVGEHSGELEHALTRAADQMESRRNLRNQVVNALLYPLLAVMLAVGVSVYLVTVVIPKVAEFLQTGGVQLPAMTQMLMDFSNWTRNNGLYVLVILSALTAAWIFARATARGREAEDSLLLHLPVTGRIMRLAGTALFARAMQIMTESGVTLLDALATGAKLLGNRRLRHRVTDARANILKGQTLAEALAAAHEFTPMLRRMASVGEASGTLPESFGETARFHEMMLAVAIRRFGMLIEPVMICVTGGIVGFVYIAFFMALFAIAGAS